MMARFIVLYLDVASLASKNVCLRFNATSWRSRHNGIFYTFYIIAVSEIQFMVNRNSSQIISATPEFLCCVPSPIKQSYYLPLLHRHSRFGGTFTVANVKSISQRDLIVHAGPSKAAAAASNLDAGKQPRKKPRNRRPVEDAEVTRRSTLCIRVFLREFCVQFLENCYNPLMYAVKVSTHILQI
jgi:hypothetical protein